MSRGPFRGRCGRSRRGRPRASCRTRSGRPRERCARTTPIPTRPSARSWGPRTRRGTSPASQDRICRGRQPCRHPLSDLRHRAGVDVRPPRNGRAAASRRHVRAEATRDAPPPPVTSADGLPSAPPRGGGGEVRGGLA
ncbi:hypothetical protein NS220_03525 [Microbacterium testaceum]|uniref:Uncharacterized protein n=1 Tax=Microbacterium testaceum TaxID=2033 RepID=A0A147EZZ5_MICTE|nr:hypothetical protein NS220_03525 [Microbacterium testaceum]